MVVFTGAEKYSTRPMPMITVRPSWRSLWWLDCPDLRACQPNDYDPRALPVAVTVVVNEYGSFGMGNLRWHCDDRNGGQASGIEYRVQVCSCTEKSAYR